MGSVGRTVLLGVFALFALAALAGANEGTTGAPAGSQAYEFQAEVNRMMKLIINSLYKNKEIFLRELVSNASDALDKIRFLGLKDPSQLETAKELRIEIRPDLDAGVLHITDTGVGMTREELIKNLGTIAKSGTDDFVRALEKSDLNMIGQFGVGFYSSFLVADRVTVTSKSNKDDTQWVWESTADSQFNVWADPEGNTLGRGTRISLHLKEDSASYLEEKTLKELIAKYSEYINYPIYLWETRKVEAPAKSEEVEVDEFGFETGAESAEEATEPEYVSEYVQVNKNRPLWTRSPSEVTEDEYNSFYRAFSGEKSDPKAHTHFVAEGEVDFRALLFLPDSIPLNFFNREEHPNLIKLFVRRVFITDELSGLLPRYLQFITGVVDSDDLPLNVSRETLQQSKLLKVIKKKLTRKILELFAEIAEDKERYAEFLKQYSDAIKFGILEDSANRKRLSKLLRFKTNKHKDEWRSLDEYIKDSKKKQNEIYFVAAESVEAALATPFLERLDARGYEVLLCTDPVDEFVIMNLLEYEGRKFVNAAKDDIKFADQDEEDQLQEAALEETLKPVLDFLKDRLSEHVEKVRVSRRLTVSPVALVASKFGVSANMERIYRAQQREGVEAQVYLQQKRVLEVNAKHPIIAELARRIEAGETEGLDDIVSILYNTAALRSGYEVSNVSAFTARVESIVRQSLNVPLDAEAEVNEKIVEPADEEGAAEEDLFEQDVQHDEL